MNRRVRFFGVFMMLSFNWDGTYGIVMMLGEDAFSKEQILAINASLNKIKKK